MSDPRDIRFKYRGWSFVYRPPGEYGNVRYSTYAIFRDYRLNKLDYDHSYVAREHEPELYGVLDIWSKNEWQDSIPFQTLIDGINPSE